MNVRFIDILAKQVHAMPNKTGKSHCITEFLDLIDSLSWPQQHPHHPLSLDPENNIWR